MSRRREVQQLKRDVARDGSIEAILALLGRSVRMGHKKLAVLRCLQAEHMGARVAEPLLAYCASVVAVLPHEELVRLRRRVASTPG